MPPNITVYCLDQITDYYDFERLCTDLMSLAGYPAIEPLGGFSDKGRDAVHVDSASGRVTIFAYSVREDWRAKLAEDASKIKKHGHPCDRLVFSTTAGFSAGERDEAVADIRTIYGWELDLYGRERLRNLLDVQYPQLKLKHPSIFPPELLELATSREALTGDHLFVSFAPQDYALAEWLTRRLTAEGYRVWCERFEILGSENYPEDIDGAIRHQTFRVIALYSRASLREPEVMRQRGLALSLTREKSADFLIPIDVDRVPRTQLDRLTSSKVLIPFYDSWAMGLRQLLRKVESAGCPKPLADGKLIAAEAFFENDVLSERVELVVTNCLRVLRIPDDIHAFASQIAIPDAEWEHVRLEWPSHQVSPTEYLSFQQPPQATANKYQIATARDLQWRKADKIEGTPPRDLVAELLRKSLERKCMDKGLLYCGQTGLRYFPPGLIKGNRLPFTLPTGVKNWVGSGGQRKFWRRSGSSNYKYALAPTFKVAQNLDDEFIVLVRLKVRFTDSAGNPLPLRVAVSRRKHLCKDWWNDDWLNRIVAIIQHLADGDRIVIGSLPDEELIVSAVPVVMSSPVSINEAALKQIKETRADYFEHMGGDEDWAEDENE